MDKSLLPQLQGNAHCSNCKHTALTTCWVPCLHATCLLQSRHMQAIPLTCGLALHDQTSQMRVCSQLMTYTCCCCCLCRLCRQTLMMGPSTCLHFTGASAPWQLLGLVGTYGLRQGVQLVRHKVLAGNSPTTTCLSTLLPRADLVRILQHAHPREHVCMLLTGSRLISTGITLG